MKKHKILIRETYTAEITEMIPANSVGEALNIARELYRSGEIVSGKQTLQTIDFVIVE